MLEVARGYMLSEEEMEEALRRMGANLGPEGLLVFDANCPHATHLLLRRTARAVPERARSTN